MNFQSFINERTKNHAKAKQASEKKRNMFIILKGNSKNKIICDQCLDSMGHTINPFHVIQTSDMYPGKDVCHICNHTITYKGKKGNK